MENSEPATATRQPIRESISSGNAEPITSIVPGVGLREFVSGRRGATGLSTGTATFEPGAVLPYHVHQFSEAITVIQGEALVAVEGRTYRLTRLDCLHVPAGTAHRVTNASSEQMQAHWAFATSDPSRELVEDRFREFYLGDAESSPGDPEHLMRFATLESYELASGTRFYDLFAGRFGSEGICGGYGEFNVATGLPCHTHEYDESITIVQGRAICYVQGRQYPLSDCDTALVPRGRPHRFVNAADQTMAMIWVYAGSEPERTLVETGYCDGSLTWPRQ